jgi:hypothetical protein
MNCPIDGAVLEMSERQGVEIDYCPKCRGVWLDRGELDKLIERSESWSPAPPPPPRREERSYSDHDDRSSYQYKKKKKSFLSEIFDD